jgi:hypothetical protein
MARFFQKSNRQWRYVCAGWLGPKAGIGNIHVFLLLWDFPKITAFFACSSLAPGSPKSITQVQMFVLVPRSLKYASTQTNVWSGSLLPKVKGFVVMPV